MKKLIFLFLPVVLLFSACESQEEADDQIILDYLETNNLTAERTEEGIYYIIENQGTGDNPVLNDQVKVHYEGYLLDGTIFDSSIQRGTPAEFPLLGVIQGWQIGIPLFKEGGSGTLLIPSSYAYGSNPPFNSGIPRNAVLAFDVELIEIL